MSDLTPIIRSRRCGLRDIYVAPVTANDNTTYTAGTPVKLGRALNAKISDKFSQDKLYSDDGVEDIVESYEGSEIELGLNTLAPQDYATFFENLYKNGFLMKSSGDAAKELALGFRSKRRNGKYEFTWYYCGKFERPEESYQTQEDKITTQTNTLKGTFYARTKEDTFDGEKKNLYCIQVDESNIVTEDTTAATAISDWFGEVQEYAAPSKA